MPNFMVINNRNEQYEYSVDSLSVALDKYIENVLGFKSGFTVTKTFWDNIKNKLDSETTVDDDRVRLVNGFCRNRRTRIKKVLTQYAVTYPISIKLVDSEGLLNQNVTAYQNGVNMGNEIIVHHNSTLSMTLVTPKGYCVEDVEIEDEKIEWNYDYNRNLLTVQSPITDTLLFKVTTSEANADWRVRLYLENSFVNSFGVDDGADWNYKLEDVTHGVLMTIKIYENGVLSQETVTEIPEGDNPIITIPNVRNNIYVEASWESV